MKARSAKAKGCLCGCGIYVTKKYVLGHNARGENSPQWKGGRITDRYGYILVWNPNHPYSNSSGYVREHRLVMEEHIKRFLRPDEEINHINRAKSDNRLENLQILTKSEHGRISGLDSRGAAKYNSRKINNYQKFIDMYLDDLVPTTQIAEYFGVSCVCVQDTAKRLNIAIRYSSGTSGVNIKWL